MYCFNSIMIRKLESDKYRLYSRKIDSLWSMAKSRIVSIHTAAENRKPLLKRSNAKDAVRHLLKPWLNKRTPPQVNVQKYSARKRQKKPRAPKVQPDAQPLPARLRIPGKAEPPAQFELPDPYQMELAQ